MNMQRTPEPELMLDPSQAQAYAAADFSDAHSRFVKLLQERLQDLPDTGHALDLGCGPGDITRRFAEAFPNWTIDAVDGSPAMLTCGRQMLVDRGLVSRVTLHELLLPAERLPGSDYQLVFSNSLLHHLRDPNDLWASIRQATQRGASVFVMDLMRPDSRDTAHALVKRYSADEPEVLRTDFFNSLLAAYTPAEVASQLAAAGLGHLQIEQVSDRHLIVWGRIDSGLS